MSVDDITNFQIPCDLNAVFLLGDNVHSRSHIRAILLLLLNDIGSRMKL